MRWEIDTQKYRPYLTDFDLAWFSTATQFTRDGFGSLIYAAPEQLAKPKSNIAKEPTTDVYAFGQLCFFFICRRDPVPLLSDNARALAEEVRSWQLEEPAHKMVDLYQRCTQQEPDKRLQDFREICDRLFELIQLLSQADHTKTIGFNAFARQLVFSMVGMSPQRIVSDTTFYSTSGQVQIDINAQSDREVTEVDFRILAQEALLLQGIESHKDAREVINQRIDFALKSYPQTRRRAGKQSPFETYLYVREVPLNIDGVEVCRQILTRVVDCIERR